MSIEAQTQELNPSGEGNEGLGGNLKKAVGDSSGPGSPRPGGNETRTPNISWYPGHALSDVRLSLLRQRPATVWLTGLSGAGKSTLASALEKDLLDKGQCCYVLDGDNLRHHLNRDLGFSAEDRRENIRRAAEVAYLMNEAGLIVITALISPFSDDRAMARDIIGKDRFIEVYVSTSTEVCEARDPKGLYRKARAGEIPEFTGVSSPYEAPLAPAMELNAESMSVRAATGKLCQYLTEHCFVR